MSDFIYEKSPLVEVVLQLRFPAILVINTDLPSKFQDSIRDLFPLYNKIEEPTGYNSFSFNNYYYPNISNKIEFSANHSFVSEDGKDKINLTKDFIAFSTLNYEGWDNFKSKFFNVYKYFFEIYKPLFFTRVGLRYFNLFSRTELGITEEWKELIKPDFLGLYISNPEKDVISNSVNSEIWLEPNEYKVNTKASFLLHNKEIVFVLDNDFFVFSSKINSDESENKIDNLHKYAIDFFSKSISDNMILSLKRKERK